MNDAEYDAAVARLRRFQEYWWNLMPLRGWDVTHHFYRDEPWDEKGDQCSAQTWADWRNLQARINWYMPHFDAETSDEDIEKRVVHEFMHCVLAQMTQYARSGGRSGRRRIDRCAGTYGDSFRMDDGQIEQQTQLVTVAILQTHKWKDDSKDEPDVYEQLARSVG